MKTLNNPDIYLARMAKPVAEKLKIVSYLADQSQAILDVGCADGTVTQEMAKLFPGIKFLGIDLNEKFLELAKRNSQGVNNLSFEKIYLRDLLARQEKYDGVIFCSVLHEFYSYGEGISSVLKALADAYELLKPGGRIIIRDMILSESTRQSQIKASSIAAKIRKRWNDRYRDFIDRFGELDTNYKLNHFLLKYWYVENWEQEVKENYVPVTFEQYETIFHLLGMKLQAKESYLIEFLKDKWKADFDLTDLETNGLRSTGILVAEKV